MTNFCVKSTISLSVLVKKKYFYFKNKIIYNFMIFVTTKMVGQKIPPPLLVLLLDPGSEIRDRIDKNQDLGSGINIPDPQHWI